MKSILVTGLSGNLGTVVGKQLIAEGYHILAAASSPASAQSLQSEHVDAAAVDLTDEPAVKAYVQKITADNSIRAAVLLVGGFTEHDLLKTDGPTLRKMLALNFETAFYLVRELLPYFEQQGSGQFILIGARPGLDANAGRHLAAYAFSKSLIFQLADMVNAYGKDKEITATVLVPSIIDTPPNRQAMPNADTSKWVSAEAIADTIRFALSDSGRQVREGVIKLYNKS